jgi:hypothetical protein
VRVDLFAESRDARRQINAAVKALKSMLPFSDDEKAHGAGADQGTGATGRNVVGLLFWVRADDVGGAAATALDVARRAGSGEGIGPELYDVVVIPRAAVVLKNDPYPRKPD